MNYIYINIEQFMKKKNIFYKWNCNITIIIIIKYIYKVSSIGNSPIILIRSWVIRSPLKSLFYIIII